MLKIIIVSSLITVSFYSYSFASSNTIDGTIDEVAVLLDCFQKNIGNIYDNKEDFSINCDTWYGDATRKNIDCSQSLLDKWFRSWRSTKKNLEKLAVPMPVCFKRGESELGYISRKILSINENILKKNRRNNFVLRSYPCRGRDKDICDNEDIRKDRLKNVFDDLIKKTDNVEIGSKDNNTMANPSDSKKVFFYH